MEDNFHTFFDTIMTEYTPENTTKHTCHPASNIPMISEEFHKVIDTNLYGSFMCCKQFIEANKGMEYGRIINIASTRWHQNETNWDAYGISKGGLVLQIIWKEQKNL